MVYDDLFGPWGRILLVAFGSGLVLVTLLLIACFVTPGCLGYECIRRRVDESLGVGFAGPRINVRILPETRAIGKNDKDIPLRFNGKPNECANFNDISYRSWRLGSLYDNGSICENSESQRDSINSNNAQFECIDTPSTVNLIQAEKQKKDVKFKEFPTELTMSLQYLPPCDESTNGKLAIGIEALSGLPPKLYNCTLEPYVALNIMKQSWTQRNRQKLHSFRTRGVRHTASPIYRETFVVGDVKQHEIKDWILDIMAYDHDRYANHTELCSLRVPLKEVKKLFTSPEIHLLNYRMKPSFQEFGEILLGISYLPTAQRLTINVMRLCNLKIVPIVASIHEFNPYVKIMMLNGKTGRKIKKKRTKVLHSIAEPEYNETLTFDLTYNQLDTIQFLVVVCSKSTFEEASTNNDHPSDSEDSVNSYRKSKDVFIGKVALGKGVRSPTERMHWFSVLQNPRKLVTVWHTLK